MKPERSDALTWPVLLFILIAIAALVSGCEGITYPSRPLCCEWAVTLNDHNTGDSIGAGVVRGECRDGNPIGLRNPIRTWKADDCRRAP